MQAQLYRMYGRAFHGWGKVGGNTGGAGTAVQDAKKEQQKYCSACTLKLRITSSR